MAFQNDTRPDRRPTSINRDGEGWGFLPILLVLLAVVAIGYFVFGSRHIFDTGTTSPSGPQTRTNITAPNPPATITVPAPATPANR